MIATTIEQSKRLLELGLGPNTADCGYFKLKGGDGEWYPFIIYDKENEIKNKILMFGKENVVVSWSLSALLEVMPKIIVHDMNEHVLCLKYAEGVAPFMYYVVESGRNKGKLIRFNNGRCVPDAYDALDAAYQMVCWLLEQGLIKKGDKK